MAKKTEKSLSAEVALRSASGKSFTGQTAITSQNIADYAPARDVVEKARRAFTDLGFEVSDPAGLGFSITAPASVFRKVFKIKSIPAGELPKGALPNELAENLVAVTFSPPPDFGPGNF